MCNLKKNSFWYLCLPSPGIKMNAMCILPTDFDSECSP